MFWTNKRFKHPSKVLTVNEKVNVMVLEVDPQNKRISLGLKQTQPNPWLELKDKYPVGMVVKGSIRNITDFGIFVGVEDGIDGLSPCVGYFLEAQGEASFGILQERSGD